jgi:hypothetical protein
MLLLLLGALPLIASAERSQDFGEYVVHFNALGTRLLPPEVTSAYDIQRSPYRGLLNIAVLKRLMGTTGEAVVARVSGTITNLTGQQTEVNAREIREATAIYYIDTFRISNEETLEFDLSILPQGAEKPFQVRFTQQFFTD